MVNELVNESCILQIQLSLTSSRLKIKLSLCFVDVCVIFFSTRHSFLCDYNSKYNHLKNPGATLKSNLVGSKYSEWFKKHLSDCSGTKICTGLDPSCIKCNQMKNRCLNCIGYVNLSTRGEYI
jgi:hypothetical protein